MPKITFVVFFSLFLFINDAIAQGAQRAIAVLDLSARNGDSNDSRLFSVIHMAKVAGIPFVVTTEVEEADDYGMILCSSLIGETTFTSSEKTALAQYVENGGIWMAPRVQDPELFAVFGIDAYTEANDRYEILWDSTLTTDAFRYMDEPEEWTGSLGRSNYPSIYKTLGYQPTTATALAHFADGSAAVTQHSYGQGQAVSIGISWKEIILRNQINRDYEAQRVTSNGFEPTTDVFSLFVRALFLQHIPHGVWMNTSPGNSKATVMITHDLDSSSAMDTLENFVDYQFANQLEATYNVTVRYFSDAVNSPFYLNRQHTMKYILDHGQALGSHSVGHFSDFADESLFPLGAPGNTRDNYQPHNDGTLTTGGNVYAECEVSKDVLEEDIGIDIRTFRSGHLAFPKYLIDVLDATGYEYNSSTSASDLLTNFPFQNKMGRSFSGAVSNVYELPVTISDVFHDDPISNSNYLEKADIWVDVTKKARQNGAPSVLLIHPNRNYKIAGMIHYVEHLPADIHFMEMSKFGDFWRARDNFTFSSTLDQGNLEISIPDGADLNKDISFIIQDGQSLNNISIKNQQNQVLPFTQASWEDDDVVIYLPGIITSEHSIVMEAHNLTISPNPAKDELTIAFELPQPSSVEITLFNLQGAQQMTLFNQQANAGKNKWRKNISSQQLAPGIYFIHLQSKTGIVARKKFVIQ